ncbi:hypothetical protein RCL1_008444 [Eukaryota sp. TZLM3-RCL]
MLLIPGAIIDQHSSLPTLFTFSPAGNEIIVFYSPLYDPTTMIFHVNSADVSTTHLLKTHSTYSISNDLKSLSISSNPNLLRLTFTRNIITIYSTFRHFFIKHLASFVPASHLSSIKSFLSSAHANAFLFDCLYQNTRHSLEISDSFLSICNHNHIIFSTSLLSISKFHCIQKDSLCLEISLVSNSDIITFSVLNDIVGEFPTLFSAFFGSRHQVIASVPASQVSTRSSTRSFPEKGSAFDTPRSFPPLPHPSMSISRHHTHSVIPSPTPLYSNQRLSSHNHLNNQSNLDLFFLNEGCFLSKFFQRRKFSSKFSLLKGSDALQLQWYNHERYFTVDCKKRLLLWGKSRHSTKKSSYLTGVDINLPSSLIAEVNPRFVFRVMFSDRPALYLSAKTVDDFNAWMQGLRLLLG